MKEFLYILIICSSLLYGCKKPYNPVVITNSASYLVVEGIINSGSDSTIIRLSRTVPLSSTNAPKPETNALVSVENESGGSIQLNELGNGRYSSGKLNLDNSLKYRLKIKTSQNQEYVSDLIAAKNTPDIDSISYKVQNNGVQLYVDSHDPNNNTKYYRWEFDETWKYVSLYRSTYKYVQDAAPVYRNPLLTPLDNIYECYQTRQSHQVLLGSSAKLAQDVISQQPIDFIEGTSGKISFGYSILVRQYALTPEAYIYWENLKKNTEQLGSIFDAQPSSISSNIHCTTKPDEPVIGYVSVSSVKSKRLFIDKYYVNLFVPYYIGPPDAEACGITLIAIDPEESFQSRLQQAVGSGDNILVNAVSPPGVPIIIGYTYASKECVDCKMKSPFGTNVKPSFWPF
jgi:hypothetical protein